MTRSSLIVCLAAVVAATFACSQVAAVGFFTDQPLEEMEAAAKAELAALDKDAEELKKISEKYLTIAGDLLKEREQTDDSFIGLGGKCIIVSHKVRIIEHLRRKVIAEALRPIHQNYLEDMKSDLADAHWRAYGAIESTLAEIAMMSNSPPKVNFLPELLYMEQLFVSRLQQAEKDALAAKKASATPRPRSASVP